LTKGGDPPPDAPPEVPEIVSVSQPQTEEEWSLKRSLNLTPKSCEVLWPVKPQAPERERLAGSR